MLTFILSLMSCKNPTPEKDVICLSCDVEEEMQRESDDLDKFNKIIIELYDKIASNPNEVIAESQILLDKVKTEADTNNVRWNKLRTLYELRAETFYKMGKFQKSIQEIHSGENNNQETLGEEFSFAENDCIHLACNYIKLKDVKKAKQYLDKARKGWYITDFIWANYYEVTDNKEKAIKAYQKIINQDNNNHYLYYKNAQARLRELEKQNSKLLTELFYPSYRPDYKGITIE